MQHAQVAGQDLILTHWPHLVGAGLGGIELAVQVAGQLQEAALRAGHPQVGAAGVKHHAEQLRRRAQAHLAIVCTVKQS